MLDLKFIRENAEAVQTNAQNKGYTVSISDLIALDDQRRQVMKVTDDLRERRNQNAAKMKGGRPEQALIDEGKQIKIELSQREAELNTLEAEVLAQYFLDLVTDGVAGVECGHRVLEDHGDVLAHHLAPLAAAEFEHVGAVEGERVGGDAPGGVDQAHQGHHGHGLARAGFADDGQDLAGLHRQVQAIDHRYRIGVAEAHVQVVDLQQ